MVLDLLHVMCMLVTVPVINLYRGIRHSMSLIFVISYVFTVHLFYKIVSNKPYKYA